MKIIAHRGYSAVYPENTMLAFAKAVEAGADGIETDVHLSKDGECMIIHDEDLMRTTGLEGAVSDYTRSQLERMDAGIVKRGEHGFTPVPSLEELLGYLADKTLMLNIELKTLPVCYPGIEEKVADLVERHGLSSRVIYSSFNWLSVWRMREIGVRSQLALLMESPVLTGQSSLMRALGIDAFHPSCHLLSDQMVEDFKRDKIALNVWTVDKEEEIRKCMAWDIDGLITNNPEASRRIARG